MLSVHSYSLLVTAIESKCLAACSRIGCVIMRLVGGSGDLQVVCSFELRDRYMLTMGINVRPTKK